MAREPAVSRVRSRAPVAGLIVDEGLGEIDPNVAALDRQTDAINAAVERFGPAADAVHGLALAQAKFCDWVKSKRPWFGAVLFLVIARTINAAPDDVPNLVHALTDFLRMFGSAGVGAPIT